VLPGDGIGPEVTREAVAVLGRVQELGGPTFDLVPWPHSADRYLATGATLTEAEVEDLRTNYDAILLGAFGDPRVPGNEHARAILLGLRFRLDLYVNLRPVRLWAADLCPLRAPRSIDFVIFRENTEGIYVGAGGRVRPGTPEEIALEEEVATARGVERIVRAAFAFAVRTGRRRVTLVDKANAMEHVGALWRRVFRAVATEYPDLEAEALYVDFVALDLVRRPERYDVLVTSNLFGDILSDEAAALIGGLGVAPSANLHPGRVSLFEPVHGSAPDIAGTGRANPIGAILSAALLLEHLGHVPWARAVEEAVAATLREGPRTPDLGGVATTADVGAAVRARLRPPSV